MTQISNKEALVHDDNHDMDYDEYKHVVLPPSSITYLYDECKRCFYFQFRPGIRRPNTPFPSIFSKIDALQREHFANGDSSLISKNLRPGKLVTKEVDIRSKPIRFSDSRVAFSLNGKMDCYYEYADEPGTGAILDFKTASPNPKNIEMYSRQLHAYRQILMNQLEPKVPLQKIDELGIYYWVPGKYESLAHKNNPLKRRDFLGGDVQYISLPIDESGFIDFLGGIGELLRNNELPEPGEKCSFCKHTEQVHALYNRHPHLIDDYEDVASATKPIGFNIDRGFAA